MPAGSLNCEDNASEKANRAIMTTDTKPKTAAVEFTIGGKTCRHRRHLPRAAA